MKRFPASLLLLLPFAALADTPAPATAQEIAHLFSRMKESACAFQRNGSWYGADEAASHLARKHDYLLRRGLIESIDDFIERAASRSSMSGKPYLVRCGNAEPVPSGDWFRDELRRFRAGRS